MPLYLALLLSLTMHIALIGAPGWLAARQRPPPAGIEAGLLPGPVPTATADAVGTEATAGAAVPQRLATPRTLTGSSLQRAQRALSDHLFYPPQAVALGLEGEVVLLLTLAEDGRLISASIARSSGHSLLDQAALDAARHIGALPGNRRQMLFPVNFHLR
jgi:protein TonB